MKKSIRTSLVVGSLVLLTVITSAPALVGAQAYYNYGTGYNARPYWNTVANMSVVQGQSLSASVQAIDENGDPLTYTLIQAPQGASFNSPSHLFTFTPNFNQLGSFPVTISATDGKSQPVNVTFYVNVSTDYGHSVYGGGDSYGYYNQAPYFTNTNSYYVASSGSTLNFYVTAIDPEGQLIRYSASGLPAGASFNNENHQFTWTPISGQRGTYALTFYATDGNATSVPLNVSIVVDGGSANYYANNNQYYPNNQVVTQYSTNTYGYNTNANYYSGNGCIASTPATYAIAGQTYIYAARACNANGYSTMYQLLVAPTGAMVDSQSGLVSWSVPANAVNQDYQFVLSARTNYSSEPVLQKFAVTVSGGTPVVTTVNNPVRNVVRYIQTPAAAPVAPAPTPVVYYPTAINGQTVNVTAGRVVPPTNYQYYGATAYGAMAPMPATAVDISTFNIAVRVSTDRQMIVTWDTNKPTRGEVVFGYSSQSRGPDLDRTILNYDFTTGQLSSLDTRHEANLGMLDLNRTYYLRVISRADNQTDISREIIFIPMTTQEGKIIVNQSEGAASASAALGNFLTSGGFLFFLLLIVIGLIVYLIMISRRPVTSRGVSEISLHDEPEIQFHHNGNGNGNYPNSSNGANH